MGDNQSYLETLAIIKILTKIEQICGKIHWS